MRTIPAGLLATIQSGSATLARIWTVVRRDGTIYRFTDHDQPIVVSSETFSPEDGFVVSDVSSSVSKAAGSADLKFMFGTDPASSIVKADLKRGLFDDCQVLIQIVDWATPSNGLATLLDGRARAPEGTNRGFGTFEVVGRLQSALQSIGRTFQPECATTIYSTECGLNPALNSTTGVVSTVTSRRKFTVDLVANPADYAYSFGVLEWTSGNNDGFKSEILTQYALDATFDQMLLSLQAPYEIQVADAFIIYKGCGNTPDGCKLLGNFENYRGFPFVPGPDAIQDNPQAV